MVLMEESEKYKGLVMELKKFYSANGISLETTAAILDTCAVVLSRLAKELRDDGSSLDRADELRNEAVDVGQGMASHTEDSVESNGTE